MRSNRALFGLDHHRWVGPDCNPSDPEHAGCAVCSSTHCYNASVPHGGGCPAGCIEPDFITAEIVTELVGAHEPRIARLSMDCTGRVVAFGFVEAGMTPTRDSAA
jgi:hypothetical protein